MPAGNYSLLLHVNNYGFIYYTPQVVKVALNSVVGVQAFSSLGGGVNLTVTGYNFDSQNLTNNIIKVCGFVCPVIDYYVISATSEQALVCTTPYINTALLTTIYS